MSTYYEQNANFGLMVKTATALAEAGFNTYSLRRSKPSSDRPYDMSGGFIVANAVNPKLRRFMYVFGDNFDKSMPHQNRHWLGLKSDRDIASMDPFIPFFGVDAVVQAAQVALDDRWISETNLSCSQPILSFAAFEQTYNSLCGE